jgi:hypothetical protein
VVNFTPQPLYPRGKSPRYPLDRILDELQSLSGRFREEKILHPTGIRTLPPVVQPLASRYTDWAISAPTTLPVTCVIEPSQIFTLYRSLTASIDFRCRFLVTALNSGDSSAFALTPLPAGHRSVVVKNLLPSSGRCFVVCCRSLPSSGSLHGTIKSLCLILRSLYVFVTKFCTPLMRRDISTSCEAPEMLQNGIYGWNLSLCREASLWREHATGLWMHRTEKTFLSKIYFVARLCIMVMHSHVGYMRFDGYVG